MDGVLEFTIGEHTYRAGKLDAVSQLHIVRRLAPILTTLKSVAEGGIDEDGLQRAAEALGEITDDKLEYIIAKCLSKVQRKRPGDTGWTAIWNASARRPQFEDLGGFEILFITSKVVMNETGPFFEGLVSILQAAGQP